MLGLMGRVGGTSCWSGTEGLMCIGVTVLVVTVGTVVGSSMTIVMVGAASSFTIAFGKGVSGVGVEETL